MLFADALLVALDEEKKTRCVYRFKRNRLAVEKDPAFEAVFESLVFSTLRLRSRAKDSSNGVFGLVLSLEVW